MRNFTLSLLLGALGLAALPVSAQVATVRRPVDLGTARVEVPVDGPRILHVTDRLMALPESRAALEAFHVRKEAGLLPVAGKSEAVVGTMQTFNVRNISTNVFEPIDFTLVLSRTRFDIWVETAQYPDSVSADVIEELRAALEDETPFGSVNPAVGIIVNDEIYFGDPPNSDGDGKTDIMVLDVRDDCDETDVCVLGFFDPVDLSIASPRDAVYLDINPGLTSFGVQGVVQTAAHEYQHLIHAGYDANELTFVNEGLSEWAEVLNGYRARAITYLDDLVEQRLPIMHWAPSNEIGTVEDYQRAGLLTNYIAEQIGPVATGSITRTAADGAAGYQAVLTPLALDLVELVRDFHVANHVNNRVIRAEYGYATSQYANLSAAVRSSHRGSESTEILATTYGPLLPGSVDYHTIEYVQDLSLRLYVPDGAADPAAVVARIRPVVVLFLDDGSVEVHEVTIQDQARSYPQIIRKAVVVVPHAQLASPTLSLSYGIEASWTPAEVSFQTEAVTYDAGMLDGGNIFGISTDGRGANRFDVTAGSILSSVSVSVMFEHDFDQSPVPPSATRDYRLSVWAEGTTQGVPAATPLFTLDRVDSRSTSLVTNGVDTLFVFDRINLESYQAELSGLPGTVFVSVENLGVDVNYVYYPVSEWDPSAEDSPSLFFNTAPTIQGWRRFTQLAAGDLSLNERVLPIRATFLVPVANEGAADLPEAYALEPNWPNPFNPSTTIAYRLPAAGRVRLAVFDVLGRRVATLVDGVMPAGRHETRFDATGLASGLYLYTLDAGSVRISRPMLLVK
jgi:hypothetical protein